MENCPRPRTERHGSGWGLPIAAHGRPRAWRGWQNPPRCRPQQTRARPHAPGGELTDEMPIATTYKGVGIHAGQPAKRVACVKREIDKIGKISDLRELFEIAGD